MLTYALLGLALLLAVLVIGRLFVIANPTTLARIAKLSLIALATIVAVTLLLRGQTALAALFGTFAALVWRVGRVASAGAKFRKWRAASGGARGGGGVGGGGASTVESEWVSMALDHASGAMDGTVKKGAFAGRLLSALDRDEVFALLHSMSGDDPQSAQLIEAYLNRGHGDWQADYARYEEAAGGARRRSGGGSAGGGGPMTRGEALDVLGLGDDAGQAEIKEAHRQLMMHYHPDHGGTDYLAAKINQAKEVLLESYSKPR